MDGVELYRVLWRGKWWILLASLSAIIFAALFSYFQTPIYKADVTVFVGQNRPAADGLGNVSEIQQLAAGLSKMVESRTVADQVIMDLGLNTTAKDLLKTITVKHIPQSSLITVTVESSNPTRAANIANRFGESFSSLISRTQSGRAGLSAEVWQQAVVPTSPDRPKWVVNLAIAGILGLLAGIGVAFLWEMQSTRFRHPEEVADFLGLPILAAVPKMSRDSIRL